MSEYKEAHKKDDDGVSWVKVEYANKFFGSGTEKLKMEVVVEHFKNCISRITAWQDKEYLIVHAADYIERRTGFPNLFIRKVLVNIYDGENSI